MFFSQGFIFIEKDFWFNLNPSENLMTRYSVLDALSKDEGYKQSYLDRDGVISREVKRYEELSEEERQENIEIIRKLEEQLSENEKIAAREIRRDVIVFHELGHCDLDRGHEIINPSIMNYDTTALIINEAIKRQECEEDRSFMEAIEECRSIDIEVSYANLIQELFSTHEEEESMSPIRLNLEAARLLYQEIYQHMQIYADAIDYEVQNNAAD